MAATFAVQSFPIADPTAMGVQMGTGVGMGSGTGAGMLPGTGMLPGMGMGTGTGTTVTGAGGANGYRGGPTLEIESKMEMAGRVRVLHFFTHHVDARAGCKVAIAVSDGSVLGFHC